jgi:hypothetical protein
MDYQFPPEHRTRGLLVALTMAALFGLPCLFFINVITAGVLFAPLAAFALLGLYAVPHYLLWGRRFSRAVAAERTEDAETS